MSNIIERLRSATPYSPPQIELAHTAHDAADVMAAMLEALEHIAASLYYNDYGDPALLNSFDESIIDAAIKAAKGEV